MPIFNYKDHDIHYEFSGDPQWPVVTFINGLTQRTHHWTAYSENLNKSGYSVLSYDLLGQGTSSKPVLMIEFNENPDILAALLDHLGIEQIYLAGVSFGGIIVLQFGLQYPDRVKGLVPMSCFTETDGALEYTGLNLYTGMVSVGFEYLVDLLIPINFSSAWIRKNMGNIPQLKRTSFSFNDLYAIQNLIESINTFEPFTNEISDIKAPTLILNGEYDTLTPRWAHELIRKNIPNSKLMIMQKVCHAFTIEIPDITCRIIADFVNQVESGSWKGDQSVWIAAEELTSESIAQPCEGDHTRAIPFMKR